MRSSMGSAGSASTATAIHISSRNSKSATSKWPTNLIERGAAYRCYLTTEDLASRREKAQTERRPFRIDSEWRDRTDWPESEPYVVRIKSPNEGETAIDDLVQGRVTVANEELDDFVLLRSDGTPTYMLAVVVDDHDMGVTHIIRGDDHLNNAVRQLAIIRAMGWLEPVYAHIPLIHGPDGAKLSKRHGALGVDVYRDELGILPEALSNYLLRLGWGHGDDEIISRDQAVEWFDIDHVGKSPSRFDLKKLEHLNGHYIREADDRRLAALVAPTLGISGDDMDVLIRAMPELKARAHDLNQLAEGAEFLFAKRPLAMSEQAAALLSDEARSHLAMVHSTLSAVANWEHDPLDAAVREVAERNALKLGKLAQPLRAALTGKTTSPGIFDVLVFLGRDESLARHCRSNAGAQRMTAKTVKLSTETGEVSLPLLDGSVGPDVVDIRKFYADTGKFTYDPGFTSTASCQSAITYIDGDEGILLHRGYPIDQLAEQSSFMEVAYLLLHGDLPKQKELDEFSYTITRHTMVHEQLATFFRGFRRDAHPMAIMCGVVGALSAFYHDSTDITDPQQRLIASHRLIAKMPTLAAMAFKYSIGQPFLYPQNDLSYTGNFLKMTFGVPAEPYEVNPVVEKALDRIFILHADHEQNASTSTVRLAGSSGANPFACIAAGIACLWGPAHGGANEAALNMLREIGDVKRIPEYIARAKDKNDPFRLMGFGHRVYKNYDPRAKVMQQTAEAVLKELNLSDPVLDVARELERIALHDDYFIEKKLYPNVDFYSGVILNAIGFPTEMFTALFALARTVGWVAQWNEMISDPEQKIGRPRQLYVGATQRDYVPVKER